MIEPPRLLAWELTAACNLECAHCRGAATRRPSPDELSTEEAMRLIDELADYGRPILIISGGEPLVRDDVFEIARYGTEKGLRVVLATNGTLVTKENAREMKEAGIRRVSISIDGATPETHDDFRGMKGSFEGALRGIGEIQRAGIELQINTTITKRNKCEIEEIHRLAETLGADAHHIFLLVPTGRASGMEEEEIPPEEYEALLNWFYDLEKREREKAKEGKRQMDLKATCAPHYQRIMRERAKLEGRKVKPVEDGLRATAKGCLGGTGFCFVSHIGEVYPCGYLPALAGKIREDSFKDIWEKSQVFNDLRDPDKLKGKCGICEYRKVCGGCRARAFAETGDYLSEEPYCIYNANEG